MSAAIQGWVKQVVRTPVVAEYDAVAHERLRFRAFFAIAIFKLFNFFGGNWDIQWHVAIGRDSLFIPPHLMVMVAFFAGLALSCALIAYETRLRRACVQAAGVMSIGPFSAPAPTFGIFLVMLARSSQRCSMKPGTASSASIRPCGARRIS